MKKLYFLSLPAVGIEAMTPWLGASLRIQVHHTLTASATKSVESHEYVPIVAVVMGFHCSTKLPLIKHLTTEFQELHGTWVVLHIVFCFEHFRANTEGELFLVIWKVNDCLTQCPATQGEKGSC